MLTGWALLKFALSCVMLGLESKRNNKKRTKNEERKNKKRNKNEERKNKKIFK